MNIGERIKELRISKLMTQSELAGDRITRNMLSCIENGSANPSISTVLYIASRLGVPAGFLLAEEGDEIVYRKMGKALGGRVRVAIGNDDVKPHLPCRGDNVDHLGKSPQDQKLFHDSLLIMRIGTASQGNSPYKS